MASLEAICPKEVGRHFRLHHSRITDHSVMRGNILPCLMRLEAQTGATFSVLADDRMGTSSLQQRGKGKGKDLKGKTDSSSVGE
eukprot:1623195-Amphidinium_carterae.1